MFAHEEECPSCHTPNNDKSRESNLTNEPNLNKLESALISHLTFFISEPNREYIIANKEEKHFYLISKKPFDSLDEMIQSLK